MVRNRAAECPHRRRQPPTLHARLKHFGRSPPQSRRPEMAQRSWSSARASQRSGDSWLRSPSHGEAPPPVIRRRSIIVVPPERDENTTAGAGEGT